MKSGFHIYKAGKRLIKGKRLISLGFILLAAIIYIIIISCEQLIKALLAGSVYTSSAVNGQALLGNYNSSDIIGYAVTVAAALLLFAIYTPLKCGFKLWYMKNAADADNRVGVIFSFFGRRYFKCLLLQLLRLIWFVALFALCFLPSTALGIGIYCDAIALPKAVLYIALAVISIAAFYLFAVVGMLYWQVGYIYTMHPDMPIIKLFKLSRHIMRNKRMALLGLILRCIPLLMSCIFILPIVYALPIMQSSFAEFAYDASL